MKKIMLNLIGIFTIITAASAADIEAGKTSYNAKCKSCHGNQGNKPIMPMYPKLGGQNPAYTVKQIRAFQNGFRKDPTMSAMANIIQGNEIENVAAYLGSIK